MYYLYFIMNNCYINDLFPSTVLYKDFEVPTPEVIKFSLDFLNKHGNYPFHSPCISTVRTKINVLDLPEMTQIKNNIISLLQIYCSQKNIISDRLAIVDGWLNLYNENGYQDLHHHPDSMISGVYYLEGTNQKDFMFQAPWYFSQPCFPDYSEINLNNCYNVDYESVTGRCIIFMSHLPHRTLPTKTQRISLSFNARYI